MTQNFTLTVIVCVVGRHKDNTMKLVYEYVILIVLVNIGIEVQSERTRSVVCKGCRREEYARIKRAKYHSSVPITFYKRPTIYPMNGGFSFPRPQGYLTDNIRQFQDLRPTFDSSRITSDGSGDEDVNNFMKILSKQELDKIVESPTFGNSFTESLYQKPNYVYNKAEKYKSKAVYKDNALEIDLNNKFSRYGPFSSFSEDFRPHSNEDNNVHTNELKETKPFTLFDLEPSALYINNNELRLNSQSDSNRIMQNQKLLNPYAYAHQTANENRNGGNIYANSNLMQEEQLPKPSNLREDDHEAADANNVQTVVKANSNSYKIEDLGTLPLMNYHSKLETVDSYKVPHYTVTSPDKHRDPGHSSAKIPVEPAPPASTAQEQSDAHLKAIKIWTHKSRGTAYTLHDDGTLSLEKPSRPTRQYYHQ